MMVFGCQLTARGCLLMASMFSVHSQLYAHGLTSPSDIVPEQPDAPKPWTVRMPTHDVPKSNLMMCTFWKPSKRYISGYLALPSLPEKVHHMSLYGCSKAPQNQQAGRVFDCMSLEEDDLGCGMVGGFEHMTASSAAQQIRFPKGVYLPVGAGAPSPFVLLQVHNNAPIASDDSGFKLDLMAAPALPLEPKVFFHLVWDLTQDLKSIPARDPNFQHSQTYRTQAGFSVFRMHLHYHTIGKSLLVTLKHAAGGTSELGKRVGDKFQDFHFSPPIRIGPGDEVVATCTWDSSRRAQPTQPGMNPQSQEMCNVFLMSFGDPAHPIVWNNGAKYPKS